MAFTLKLSSYDYDALRELPERELRAEYSRLRDIAHKRLNRLAASSTYSSSQTYLRYRNSFPVLANVKKGSVAKLAMKLSDLEKFLSLETSTLTGAKATTKKIISGLQKRGYTSIKTEEDLRRFGRYMDFNRALKKGGKYDSDRVQEMMEATSDAGLTPKDVEADFDFWMQNYDKISDAEKEITGVKKGSKAWVRMMKDAMSGS